jgi:hypothetical protein
MAYCGRAEYDQVVPGRQGTIIFFQTTYPNAFLGHPFNSTCMAEHSKPPEQSRLQELFDAYLTGTLNPGDREELVRGLETPEGEALMQGVMSREISDLPSAAAVAAKEKLDQWLVLRMGGPGRVVKVWRWAAAAILIGLVGTSVYIFSRRKQQDTALVAARYKNDLPPGKVKALLKLSDGKVVSLDDSADGDVEGQQDARIVRKNGWLSYSAGNPTRFNDVSTPVSAQIKVILPDGTKVWLDAASSLHFPTAFAGGTREVTVTGQAFFEVAPNAKQAFIVHARDQSVQVLGTQFNVDAYGSVAVKTTLEQGSVLVRSREQFLLLKPGQQAEGMTLNKNPDLEEVLAWKNGEFRFKGAPLEAIMSQVARWYGAEIVYKDKISEEFVGKIPRDVPVSKLLNYLEATGLVHFQVEGHTIVVMK